MNPDVKIGATNPGVCLLKKFRAEKMKFKNQTAGEDTFKGHIYEKKRLSKTR